MKKILIIGCTIETSLIREMLIEEYGNDIELFTVEDAQLKGITARDFDNIPTCKIEAPKTFDERITIKGEYHSSRVGKGGRAKNRSKYQRQKTRRK